jgi:hypothetical protein
MRFGIDRSRKNDNGVSQFHHPPIVQMTAEQTHNAKNLSRVLSPDYATDTSER